MSVFAKSLCRLHVSLGVKERLPHFARHFPKPIAQSITQWRSVSTRKKTYESQWESLFPSQELPSPWSSREKAGCRWYVNSETGQELQATRAATGHVYYYDHVTGESQWQKPWEKEFCELSNPQKPALRKVNRKETTVKLADLTSHNHSATADVAQSQKLRCGVVLCESEYAHARQCVCRKYAFVLRGIVKIFETNSPPSLQWHEGGRLQL